MLANDHIRSLPVRFSRLKHMGQSPLHYATACFEQDDEYNTPSIMIGRAVHSWSFGGKYVTYYENRRQGADWESFRDDNADNIVLTLSQYEQAMAMMTALRQNKLIMAELEQITDRELTIMWEFCGRQCQSTVDALSPSALLELKTTVSANPRRFMGDALRRAYHGQCSYYRTAIGAVGRPVPLATKIIAVENKKPFSSVLFSLTPRTLEAGEKIWRGWFEQLLVCEAAGEFPGYTQGEVSFDIDDDQDGAFSIEIDGEEVEV